MRADWKRKPKKQAPIIEKNITKWKKKTKTKQATTFTLEDLRNLYQISDTKETLLWKAYAIVSIAYGARGCEAVA